MHLTMPLALIASLIALLFGLFPLPGLGNLQIHQGETLQSCSVALAPFTFEMDNLAGTAAVPWSAVPVERLSNGAPWATLEPAQGTLKAGQHTQVDVVPNILACQVLADIQGGAGVRSFAALIAASAPAAIAYHVQVTSTGKTRRTRTLAMSLTTNSSSPTPSPSPTITPTVTPMPSPSSTVTPILHGKLAISSGTLVLGNYCGDPFSGVKLTLSNRGDGTLTWQPRSTGGITFSPAGGRLNAGASVSVAVSGTKSNTALTITWLDGGRGNPRTQTIALSCVPKVVTFSTSPSTYFWDCPSKGYSVGPITLTLDNTGSNTAVGWQISARESPNQGPSVPWATFSAVSGTVAAGGTATVIIYPYTDDSDGPTLTLCNQTTGLADYHADLTLTSGGSGSFTFTYTINRP